MTIIPKAEAATQKPKASHYKWYQRQCDRQEAVRLRALPTERWNGTETGCFSDSPKGPGQPAPPRIYICSNCSLPTAFCDDQQIP
jgi:hypothetical protein